MLDHVTPADELVDKALALAGEFAANPSPQLLMTKQLLSQNGSEVDRVEVQRRESELLRVCWETPEHKEAVAAFIEKRPPNFRRL